MAVFAEKGLRGTADDVAVAAGVSRRTVFRHFPTHGELFALVIVRVLEAYQQEVPGAAAAMEDFEPGLLYAARQAHRLNQEIMGAGFWDIHTQGAGSEPEVLSVLSEFLPRRYELFEAIANAGWKAKGGHGTAPRWVVESCILCLSGFATAAAGSYEIEDPVALSAKVFAAVLAEATNPTPRSGMSGDTRSVRSKGPKPHTL